MILKNLNGRRRRRRLSRWRARGERRKRKTRRNHQVRREEWVRRVARVVERMGLVRRRNWDAKRKRKVQTGVGGWVYVGVLVRKSGRRGGR